MATVFTETLGQVVSSNFQPVTTGNYYLRLTPFSSNTYTGTHLGNGVWSFGDVANGLYQMWNASAQVTNWGTKCIFNNETLFYVDLTSAQSIAGVKTFASSPIVPAATSTGQAMRFDETVRTTADQTVAGVKTFSSNPIVPAASATGHPVRYDEGKKAFVVPTNSLQVSDGLTSIAGESYTTIQAAINYAVTQTPLSTSRWKCFINPKSNTVGYSENITFQEYVDLIGIGLVKITGTMTSLSANSRLENLFWNYSGNLTVGTANAKNCIFEISTTGSPQLTLTSGTFINCGFYAYSTESGSPTIVSGGNNTFINCWSNVALNPDSSDKGSVISLNENVAYNY